MKHDVEYALQDMRYNIAWKKCYNPIDEAVDYKIFIKAETIFVRPLENMFSWRTNNIFSNMGEQQLEEMNRHDY